MRFKQWGMQKSGTASRCGEDCSFVAEQGPAGLDGRQCRWQGTLWHRPYLCGQRYPDWHCNARLWSITSIFITIFFKYTMLFKTFINKSLQSCSRSSVVSVKDHDVEKSTLVAAVRGWTQCEKPEPRLSVVVTAYHCINSSEPLGFSFHQNCWNCLHQREVSTLLQGTLNSLLSPWQGQTSWH